MSNKDRSHTNRLIHEKSPYLQQHAHNPVDWYPWGDGAFREAKKQNKLIYLSIGYATCHWCHVMERESFENSEIARMMNDTFINIKVDKEELPHIDSLYMELAQTMLAGAAGWPLNLVLTPGLKPLFAATYMPPTSRLGLIGMKELVQRMDDLWNSEERENMEAQAEAIVQLLIENKKITGEKLPQKEIVDQTVEVTLKLSDPVFGGMKGAPKFPIAYLQTFLMNYSVKTKDVRALFLAERTLQMMYQGGIYDHVGGGFSRYTIDEEWKIPHFEKMLYDNAQLLEAYTNAFVITEDESYKIIAEDIATYVLRDMQSKQGGFFSAEDSESQGEEGLFYTWLFDDVMNTLGEKGEQFIDFYNITPEGNFNGRNILNIPIPIQDFAEKRNIPLEDLKDNIKTCKQILWKVRNTSPRPFKDTKVITAWNGMMIHSLAKLACVTGNEGYIEAAENAASFIKQHLWDGNKLMRRWIDEESMHAGSLLDYTHMVKACLTLFEANKGTKWLRWAIELVQILNDLFKSQGGAYYEDDGLDPSIIVRNHHFADGSEASGNAIQTENLLRLYNITLNERYVTEAEDVLKGVAVLLETYPPGYIYHCTNVGYYYDSFAVSLVIALNENEDLKNELMKLIFSEYIPHFSVIWARQNDKDLFEILPFLKQQGPIDGKTTLYVCYRGLCEKPLTSYEEMKNKISNLVR